MHSWDLEMLRREYEKPASKEDELIRMELNDIAELSKKCDKEEFCYADAITRKLCQVICILKQQYAGQYSTIEKCEKLLGGR